MIADIRFAVRMLIKTPAFTAIAVVTLALGIGLATTVFSAVNALLIKPLPLMQDQERLVVIEHYLQKVSGDRDVEVDYPTLLDARKYLTTIEGIGADQSTTMIISEGGKPDRYLGSAIQPDLFQTFGVKPILGRSFHAEENAPAAEPVVLLGHELWQNRFAGSPAVLGKNIQINGVHVTIIGVMPRGWRYPETAELWMPLRVGEEEHKRGNFFLEPVGKLKTGVSLAQANVELERFGEMLAREHPDVHEGSRFRAVPLRDTFTRESKSLTLLLMGAVLFVHLIACANIVNLLLARGATRTKEFGIRAALGANRRRIVGQLLIESALLGLAGSVGGVLVAFWGIDLMCAMIPVELPFWLHFDLDPRVLLFAGATGLLSGMLFGIIPALRVSRPNLTEVLKEGGRTSTGSAHGQRVRDVLVIAEVAVALILLVGAGLMIRSFLKLQQTDLGIRPENVLTFRVGLPQAQYPDEAVVGRFFKELIPMLAAVPGIEAAGAITALPVSGQGVGGLWLEGEPKPKVLQDGRVAGAQTITPGYFESFGIPLLRGRDFAADDDPSKPPVAIIDERAAQLFFPGQNPLGKRFAKMAPAGEPEKWFEIVGVTGNVIYDRLTEKRALPTVYFAHQQDPPRFMSVALRTRGAPASFTNAARTAVLSVNKDIPIYNPKVMATVVKESFWERRFFGSLFTAFAVIALFLASIGLYGVMSYSVRQRTQEIGVRMALGAQARDVLAMITKNGLKLIGIGVVIGLAGAYFFVELLREALEQVSAHDPFSFIVVPIVLLLVGWLACYLPARAATRINPIEALRYE